MDSTKVQLLEIEPKKALYFEGPFTESVTSHIKLTNPQAHAVCFKVKTTVPKRYCVRPSSGIINAGETLMVEVILQPFSYDPLERSKHKFMIQSMPHPDDESVPLDQLWKEVDQSKLADWKLVCILRMPGELVIDPSHDIVFGGPVDKPMTSIVTLTNPSNNKIRFRFQPSSQNIQVFHEDRTIEPGQTCKVTVKAKPLNISGNEIPRERLTIESVSLKNDEDNETDEQLFESAQTSTTVLKCIFSNLPSVTISKIQPVRHSNQLTSPTAAAASPEGMKSPSMDALMSELAALRQENKAMKESTIHNRRNQISDGCLSSAADGGAAIGRHGALAAIASIPPTLYLILAFFIGLLLGKFVL